MGMYDTVYIERLGGSSIEAQVKCWECTMREITLGDKVPDLVVYLHDGTTPAYVSTYNVILREGGYLSVYRGFLVGWDEQLPEECKKWPHFDKWGAPYSDETSLGLLGEKYR